MIHSRTDKPGFWGGHGSTLGPAVLPSQHKTKAETWRVVGWGSDGVLDRGRRWRVQSPRARESSVHRPSSVYSGELPVIQNEWAQRVVKKKKLRDCSGKHQPTPECLMGYAVVSVWPLSWEQVSQKCGWVVTKILDGVHTNACFFFW